MPQSAPSLHLYVRDGGYEPSSGFHFDDESVITAAKAQAVATALATILSELVAFERWEAQSNLGTVLTGGDLSVQGTWLGNFSDFKDCVHFTLASEGPEGKSGFFLHPRPNNAFVRGQPTAAYDTAVANVSSQLVSLGVTDSEAFNITGILRYKPSRRNRVRVAP